jgi:hypothetical protein
LMVFSGCSNNGEKSTTENTTDTTAAMNADTAKPAEFVPFDFAEINHTVKDYAKWRPIFDADSAARKESGMNLIVVGRGQENTNKVYMAFTVSDVQKARDFTANPKLKEVMTKAGVTSKPELGLYHALRFNPDSKEKQWVIITHKVKDFDAWVKVYDEEGTAKRAEEGMIDVLLAKGIDDANLVYIVFDIKDMEKAKAALSSEAKKNLMMSAGVEGAPRFDFYTTAE